MNGPWQYAVRLTGITGAQSLVDEMAEGGFHPVTCAAYVDTDGRPMPVLVYTFRRAVGMEPPRG